MKLDDLEDAHEAARSQAMRSAYVKWRMADVPSIYADLMPPTYNVRVLWDAERAIRCQVEADRRHLENPWRQLGTVPTMLDFEDLTPAEKIEFGLEIAVPVGLDDAPKAGRWEELAGEIARQRAASPAWAEAEAMLRAADEREAADAAPADGPAALDA